MSLTTSGEPDDPLYATGHDVFRVSRDGGQTWSAVTHDLPGSDIHGFAQDPVDPRRLFAYVADAGVFTSADAATTWALLPSQPEGGAMMVTLACNGTRLYAAAGADITASQDFGATWTPLPAQPPAGVLRAS